MNALPAIPELLTAEEVASRLRLALSTIYGLARSGELPSVRIGGAVRFDPADLNEYLSRCRSITTKPASAGATSLTALLTDADSALESYFHAAGRQPKPKATPARKTRASTPLRLAHSKTNR
jgi:excisionase family DNA binding protein